MSLQPQLQIVKYPGRCLVHKIRDCDSIVFKDLPCFFRPSRQPRLGERSLVVN
jgi:hypothetical protein